MNQLSGTEKLSFELCRSFCISP